MSNKFKIHNCKNLDKKSRSWGFLIYEESVNKDYIDILSKSGLKCCISPLHDKDIYTSGEKKGQLEKPHRHGIILFNGGRKLSAFEEYLEAINAYNTVEIITDPEAYRRYEFHIDDPDKYQYNEEDLIYINSTKYDYVKSEFKEIINYINDYDIKSFKSLVNKLLKNEQNELLLYLSKNAYYVNLYLNDKAMQNEKDIKSLLYEIIDICDNIDVKKYNDDKLEWEITNIKRLATDNNLN